MQGFFKSPTRFRKLFLLLGALLVNAPAFAEAPRSECFSPSPTEPKVKQPSVSTNLQEIATKFIALYESGDRLHKRAYWSTETNRYMSSIQGKEIELPTSFIQVFTQEIELALQRGYAQFVAYSDFGHGHLFVPEKSKISYSDALSSPKTRILFHTIEFLQIRGRNGKGPLPTEAWPAWRYFSRNFYGTLGSPENLEVIFADSETYNTVRDMPEYSQIGTFYFSASKNGCFPFKTKKGIYYFDISFEPQGSTFSETIR